MKHPYNMESLQHLIEAAYEIEDALLELQSETADELSEEEVQELGRKEIELQQERQQLSISFQKLADHLFEAGAFDSKEQARAVITINPDTRLEHIGPDGVVPDDGALNPDEEAAGILALLDDREYYFSVPVAYCVTGGEIEFQWTLGNNQKGAASGSQLYLANGRQLSSVGIKGFDTTDCKEWMCANGIIVGKNYNRIRSRIEMLCQEIQGGLLALNFAEFWNCHLMSSPKTLIGSGKTWNAGVYVNSIVGSVAYGVRFSPVFSMVGDVDKKLGPSGSRDRQVRLFERLFASDVQRAREIRQALRMYLRAHAAWSEGEKAMFLATMLEGLLLDRRKDDLSSRLQDAVAYWVGSSAADREAIRKDVRDLYAARSEFVHNGELAPKTFREKAILSHAQKVIRKEIENL
ncbi:hypothetical protein [Mesorhizobium sp. LjNodule214]|uniref:hypothetical protein n=1 Tax=Mesorhizobium sp. LjNodule214 TaxID=3342252 RepID=UPI003ECCF1E8